MKFYLLGLLFLFLAACSAWNPGVEESLPAVELLDLGKAPELKGETWLNTDQPLQLNNLRGKVVLLDMWTFG
jgi:hypothetical protein